MAYCLKYAKTQLREWHTTWNGRKVFLRSYHEKDFAQYLDSKQIDYLMEPFRIKYWDSKLEKERVAIPDFYLPEENTIIEIKCKYTLDKKNMQDKKKAYLENGYNFLLICSGKVKEI